MSNKKTLQVVIADDEAVIRMGLKSMIQALGYEVIGTASNGEDAIEKTMSLKPDLLLLDIKMPKKDGLEVAETLANEYPLPIIMLTAYTEKSMIERAANAAVIGYLVKPIQESKLKAIIEVSLARFETYQTVAKEAKQLRDQLETRELIDQAKSILIQTGRSEVEAYQQIQMTARKNRRTMRQVAEAVIMVQQRSS
ncbi:MAG: response regulator [Chloroflexota bacterium]